MSLALLVDIGSTFTKAALVDLNTGRLVGRAQAPTSVDLGVHYGLVSAEKAVLAQAQASPSRVTLRLAASSAAGGLRMVTVGLVPELTAEAARLAALGAGARVLAVYAYKLSSRDIDRIIADAPDILLLCGGTDGGDTETVLHNAQRLSRAHLSCPVVYAGNKNVADEVVEIFSKGRARLTVTDNVMPKLGQLHVESVRNAIRDIFFENIANSKGLSWVRQWADDEVCPTPAAVQKGVVVAQLLLGPATIMAFDVGGATTDVYSLGGEEPRKGAYLHGLPMPRFMRTVEGDLGLRVSLPSLMCAATSEHLAAHGLDVADLARWVTSSELRTSADLPRAVDEALASVCVELAAVRHTGTLELLPTPMGYTGIQRGKDLSGTQYIIGTGGMLTRAEDLQRILSSCRASPAHPLSLLPLNPQELQDKNYILYAAGLLAERYPSVAKKLVEESLSGAEVS